MVETIEVSDCNDCPFVDNAQADEWDEILCNISEAPSRKTDDGKGVIYEEIKRGTTTPPEWCALRKGPHLVKLL